MIVELQNIESRPYGKITIPPFDKPPMTLTWRGLTFLRKPKEGSIPRYREVSWYAIPDDQGLVPD